METKDPLVILQAWFFLYGFLIFLTQFISIGKVNIRNDHSISISSVNQVLNIFKIAFDEDGPASQVETANKPR
jgi:hypothetical protein